MSFILTSKTDAANINPKILESREQIANSHPVNITRSHDGDIIIVKGEPRKKKRKERKSLLIIIFFASLISKSKNLL